MIFEERFLNKFSHQGGGRPSPGASFRRAARTRGGGGDR